MLRIVVSDDSGAVVERYEYSVYGNVQIVAKANGETRPASIIDNPYYFTGRRLDGETSLYYYRARMYSATIGRFLQTDPIGYADGINWYAYCANNPIMYFDPQGYCREGTWSNPIELTENEFQVNMAEKRDELASVPKGELGIAEIIKLYGAWDSPYYKDNTVYSFRGKVASGHELNYYAIGMLAEHRRVHPVLMEAVIHLRKISLGHFGATSNTIYFYRAGRREYVWRRDSESSVAPWYRMLALPLWDMGHWLP